MPAEVLDEFPFGFSATSTRAGTIVMRNPEAAFLLRGDGAALRLTDEQWLAAYQLVEPLPGTSHYEAEVHRLADGSFRCEVFQHLGGE